MTNQKLQQIHDASMRILERTGMKFDHPEAIRTLKDHGIKVDGNTAYFKEDQVMEWVRKAPSSFEFCARNPEYNVTIGGENSVIAPAFGSPNICDQTGIRRKATMKDFVTLCKLYEVNPMYRVNGGWIVQPNDVPAVYGAEMMHYASLRYSEKCIQTAAGNEKQMETLMEMSKAVFGDLDKARVLTIVDTTSPLMLDAINTETLMVFGKYHQPVSVTSVVMSGTTGPMTLAGNIALNNAEILASIALSQMMNPGTPVLYSSQSHLADMATGTSAPGSVESSICAKYSALMGRFYDLPSRGGGSITDARVVNAQAGYESMMLCMTSYQNKMNYMFQSAGIIDSSLSVSYEKMILDFEINEMVQRFVEDVKVTEETLAEDLIHEVGPGGNYMIADHTFEWCRKEPFIPKIATRGNIAHPDCEFELNIEKRLQNMLDRYVQPKFEEDVVAQLNSILKEKGIDAESYMI